MFSFFMPENPMGVDKRSAMLGFVGGFLVLCTIGFFILLAVVLTRGVGASSNAGAQHAAAPSVVDPGTQPAAEITVAPVTDGDYVRGNKNAKITLIEYSDLECPFCKQFHNSLREVFADKKYADNVLWVYRHYPLTSIHPKAPKEAEAAECAGELGGSTAFWKYIDRVFEVTPANNGLDLAELPKIAQHVGVNVAAFNKCLDSGSKAAMVTEDAASGDAAGVQGTPHTIVLTPDGQKIPFSGALPASQIKQILDSVL